MATFNNNFKVKNGLDASGDISTTASLYANKTSFASNIVSSGPGSVTYWKIATLPTSSAGTYDHLILDVVLDDDWGSAQKANAKILFSNRNAFTYRYYLNGTVRSAARVLAYTEANGSVSLYLRAGSGNFCSFSYNITHGIDNGTTVIKNPTSTTTAPTGTLAFDSSNIGTYVPESYVPYTGQPIIRGLVNSSGAVSGVSFVKSGGTSAQFLKADGSVDSNTYLPTTSSYFAGHNPEGRLMYNTYLTNDMANARLRGSAVAATQNGVAYTISNADWDAMFDGTASFLNISPTSGFTFPLVITVPLPRTLTYGASVGISFGSTGFRANSVQIEVFSLDSSSWVSVFNTTTNTSEDIFTTISGIANNNATGINQVRYTISSPNSTQLRIAHLWAYNFNSDMWSQTMMPRAGGAFYGAIRNNNTGNGFGVSGAPGAWGGFTPTVEIRGSSSSISGINFFMNGGPFVRAYDSSGNPRGAWANDGSIVAGPSNTKLGTLSVYSDASGTVGQIIRGASGQSVDLFRTQDNNANTLSKIDSAGKIFVPGGTTIYDYAVESGGSTDTAWKKLIEVNCASGLYTGASYEIEVVDSFDNYGIIDRVPLRFRFYVKVTRSGGVQDDVLAASVTGPSVNYVRVVKTSNALYEIQVRQPDIFRIISFKARRVGQNNTSESYNPSGRSYGSLDAGSTTGTIYVPVNDSTTSANFLVDNFSQVSANRMTIQPLGTLAATTPLLTLTGTSTQNSSYVEFRNSGGTALTSITSTGNITTSAGISLTGSNSPINLPTGGNGTSGQVLTSAGSGSTPTWTTAPTLSANNVFTGVNSFNNAVNIGSGSTGAVGLEIGSTNGTGATTPFIDFHSGATAIDFDSRIIASGGNGTNGQGTLTYTAATSAFTGDITANGRLTLKPVANAANQSNGILISNTSDAWQSGLYLKTDGSGNPRLTLLAPTGGMGEAIAIDSAAKVGIGIVDPPAQLTVVSALSTRIASIIRGASGQSVNIQEWQANGPTTLASVSQTGKGTFDTLNAPNGAFFGNLQSQPGNGAYLAVQGYAAGHRPFLVRGFGATTANLADYQDGAGTVIGGRNANAQIFTGGIAPITTSTGGATTATSGTGTVATITTTSAHNLATGDRVTVAGITPTGYNGTFSVASTPTTTTFTYANATTGSQTVAGTVRVDAQVSTTSRSAATVGLVVRGATSQVTDIQQWQISDGTVRSYITADGSFLTSSTLTTMGNLRVAGTAGTGGGSGVIGIANAGTAPTSNPTGGGVLFVESGAIRYRGASNAARTIINADGTDPNPVDGTTSTAAAGVGYMGLPQNATTTGSYTVVAADAGKHIYASATRTVTINSNANLALPIGTTLTFIAGTGATMTIAITSDTMYLAGPGTTGSRTLAPFGMATAVKITSTSWMISGNGLT